MKVRFILNGTFEGEEKRILAKPEDPGYELTNIKEFKAWLDFDANKNSSVCSVLWLRIKRECNQTLADLIALKLQYGRKTQGEAWVMPSELLLYNELETGEDAMMGKFTIGKTQVIAIEPSDDAGNPMQEILLSCSDFQYEDLETETGNIPEEAAITHSRFIATGEEA